MNEADATDMLMKRSVPLIFVHRWMRVDGNKTAHFMYYPFSLSCPTCRTSACGVEHDSLVLVLITSTVHLCPTCIALVRALAVSGMEPDEFFTEMYREHLTE